MARERSGTLILRKKGWCARITIDRVVDGEVIQEREWCPLGTDNKTVAKRKMKRLLAELEANGAEEVRAAALSVEQCDAYAQDWLERRDALGLATSASERRMWNRYWKPAIGSLPLDQVRKQHIKDLLEAVATGRVQWTRTIKRVGGKVETRTGKCSRQTVAHIRATAYRMFDAAEQDEIIVRNPVRGLKLPSMREVRRERAVMTDFEIGRLLSRPDVDPEIKMLVLLSRTVGGMRSGDLNAWDWTSIDLLHFEQCVVPRAKTGKPQRLEIPESVRPFLAFWWHAQGSPTSGPVFPVRRGPRAGKDKKRSNMSYAKRLRRELLKAGVTRHELHSPTATTLPVDFHSTRRAYNTALARAGVNVQTAMVLAGHSDPKVHQRYINSAIGHALPAGAMPILETSQPVSNDAAPIPENVLFFERDTGLEPATPSLGSSCSTS